MGIAAAVVGGAVIGGVASNKAASKAADAQNQSTAAAQQAATSELEFAKAQQAGWDEVFGPTQDILAEYYNTLDPDDVAAKQVQEIQKGYQNTQVQLDKALAQRGMGQSGLAAETMSQAMYQTEQQKAVARSSAPAQVAGQQMGFLQLGLNQAQGINQATSAALGSQTALAIGLQGQATQQSAAADAAYSKSIGNISTAVGQGFQTWYNTPNSAISPYSTIPASTDGTLYAGGATW